MKIYLLLLACLPLVGCGTDSVTFHPQDFGGVTASVTSASVTVKKAQAIAQSAYDNGAAAKSPAILQLQQDLTNTQDSLTQALEDVATLKADDQKQVDAANKVQAEETALAASEASKQIHWVIFWFITAFLMPAAAIAAPLLVTATGAAGLVASIPIIGSIVGTGERIAVAIAAGISLFALMEIGRLFRIL